MTHRDRASRLAFAVPLMAGASLGACWLATSCSDVEEGTRRALVEHWPAHDGLELRIRCAGEEVYSGGKWLKDGDFVFIDDDGRETRGHYALGLEAGEWLHRYESDSTGRGEYRAGLREGTWTYMHADGYLEDEGTYVEGQRHGTWRSWYGSGQARSEVHWVDGQKSGEVTYWDPDGTRNLALSGRYENGRKVGE